MKKLIWATGTRRRLKNFPRVARKRAGEQLYRVQEGLEPEDWRPMRSVGPGAREIRIHQPHEHRVIYVATFPEGVYVLHAFEKKSPQTPQKDITTARANYAEIEKSRARQ
jgi:phage-related protein